MFSMVPALRGSRSWRPSMGIPCLGGQHGDLGGARGRRRRWRQRPPSPKSAESAEIGIRSAPVVERVPDCRTIPTRSPWEAESEPALLSRRKRHRMPAKGPQARHPCPRWPGQQSAEFLEADGLEVRLPPAWSAPMPRHDGADDKREERTPCRHLTASSLARSIDSSGVGSYSDIPRASMRFSSLAAPYLRLSGSGPPLMMASIWSGSIDDGVVCQSSMFRLRDC